MTTIKFEPRRDGRRGSVMVLRSLHPGDLAPLGRRRLDRFSYGAVVGFMVAAFLFGLGLIRAEEPERFSPAARGPRASYQTEQVQQWREAVDAYAWPTETALLVIACESQGDPGAVNRSSGAAGLFQLYGWSWLAERLTGSRNVFDAWVNIRTAFALWQDSGGRFGFHWSASSGCWAW